MGITKNRTQLFVGNTDHRHKQGYAAYSSIRDRIMTIYRNGITPIAGRPQPSANLVGFLESAVSPQSLAPDIMLRAQLPHDELMQFMSREILQRREAMLAIAGRQDLIELRRQSPPPNFPLGATIFGRHYDVVNALRESDILPDRGVKILQGGAGIYEYSALTNDAPDIIATLEANGFESEGASYESAELAALAGEGGGVHLFEIDDRVITAVQESLYRSFILSRKQPVQGFAVTREAIQNPAKLRFLQEQYRLWYAYLENFLDRTLGSSEVGQTDNGIWSFAIKRDIAERVSIYHADLGVAALDETYDIAWLTNLYEYISLPLWFSALFTVISNLPIQGEDDSPGGVLVVDRFDIDMLAPEEIGFKMGEILTLAGLTVWGE